MNRENIIKLVKSLEPHFYGYKAQECTLINDLGMKISFSSSWNNKTYVSGLGAKKSYSIGCSFAKPLKKITRDIKTRLIPEYRDDFISYKREQEEAQEFLAHEQQKFEALAVSCDGEIVSDYRSSHRQYIKANNLTIHQSYSGDYEITVSLNFEKTLKYIHLIEAL